MHVAQFVHRYPPAVGGAEAWAHRLSRHLLAEGHSVTVWTTTAIDLSAFTQRGHREAAPGRDMLDGVTIRRYSPQLRFAGRKFVMKAASLLPGNAWRAMTQHWSPLSLAMWRDAGRAEQVDVVHSIAFPYASIHQCALRFARRNRARFVITPFLHLGNLNDPSDNIRRAYTAPHLVKFLREADLILVQTPTEQAAVERLGIQADRIVLQGLGVDPTECTGGDRDSARRDWGVQPGEFVIGHLANLSMEKGSVDLLAAAEMAQQAGCQIRVILAGPEMPSFRQFWKWSGPNDWIVRLGVLTDQQRRDFFAGVDLFVLPSISDSFGLVFLEAWANAVPVIGYRAGGVVDVIRHEQDGLLVRCGDLNELTKAIRRMSANELERLAWGRAGQERLPRDFRWEDKLRVAREAITEWPQNIEWPREGTKRHEK